MNHQRLRFALARGARIELKNRSSRTWHIVYSPGWYTDTEYRVLPRDAALQYGPLSAALIDVGTDDDIDYNPYREAAMTWVREYVKVFAPEAFDCSAVEFRMFCLFVAEYLADQGL